MVKNLLLILSRKHLSPIIYIVIILCTAQYATSQSADSVARLMFERTKQIKTLTYTMTKKEMTDGEMQKQIAFVKLNRSPFKVYTRQISPDEGLEVLYKEGDRTALINPNGFPWINIRLDPKSNLMTRDQHHTIIDAGFDRFISILEHLFNKYGQEIDEMATVKDHVGKDGRPCWLLEFKNPYFQLIDYTVKDGEDILTLGHQFHISTYLILKYNESINNYSDVSTGQVIKIPNDYSPKMSLMIDKEMKVPVEIIVHEQYEIFEHYQFNKINIDPPLSESEFTPEYEEYGF